MRCAAVTRAGDQCQRPASYDRYCYSHAPETANKRHADAVKGGKSSGGELPTLRREIRDLIKHVREGEIDLDRAGIMLRGYRALMQLEELRLDAVEVQSLRADLEALKSQEGVWLR
jgi:molybdenum cofactor biosynthesis enzyme MoaA